jgi:2-phospho-L-lactate guanylyltransferase (CobY/MobA/RfbA family)
VNIKQKIQRNKNIEKKKKWVTFTFFGSETRTITKLFKNTDIAISYHTRNNIKHVPKTKKTGKEMNIVKAKYTNYNALNVQKDT